MRRFAIVILLFWLMAWTVSAQDEPPQEPAPNTTTVSAKSSLKPSQPEPDPQSLISGDPREDAAKSDKNSPGPVITGFTQAREAAALTFVRTHHLELATLVESLKTTNPVEYQKAINDLFQTSEKLAQIQEVSPPRYDLALRTWQVDSKIQLLVARLSMGPNPEIERKLRKALDEKITLRQQQLTLDRERAMAQVSELDAELKDLKSDRDKQVDKQLNRLLKGIK